MLDVKIKGFAELDKALRELPDKIERNIIRSALRQGAKVIEAEAKRLCPIAPPTTVNRERYGNQAGELRNSIRSSVKVHKGVPVATISAGNEKAYYAKWVEFGTAGHLISVKDGPTRMTRKGPKKISVKTLNKRIKAGTLMIGSKAIGKSVWHPGSKAVPFMRTALDTAARAAIAAFGAQVKKRLTKEGINTPDLDIGGG